MPAKQCNTVVFICMLSCTVAFFVLLLVMDDNHSGSEDDDVFLGPNYLEDYDLYPYNTQNFSELDVAVQLQWCEELQSDVLAQIGRWKKRSFNAQQKKRKITDLYELYYIHVGAGCRIREAVLNPPVCFNGKM